jgi:hypothetical protein
MISRNQSGGSKPASNKISVGKNMRTSTTKARYNQQKPTSIAQEKKGSVCLKTAFLGFHDDMRQRKSPYTTSRKHHHTTKWWTCEHGSTTMKIQH